MDIEALSPKRKQILSYIGSFIQEKGYAPAVRNIAQGCGISSSSVVQYHLNILEQQGYISRDREVSRSIGLVNQRAQTTQVPVLGTIAAGQPIPVPSAETWTPVPEEMVAVPSYLTRSLKDLYLLRVKGTSMIDALIDDGDMVLVQAASTADDGTTVAVWLRDRQEVTLKRLYHEGDRICLKPANSRMKPIYCRPEDVEVQGRVVGVLRKL